jgi:hypothetical protein
MTLGAQEVSDMERDGMDLPPLQAKGEGREKKSCRTKAGGRSEKRPKEKSGNEHQGCEKGGGNGWIRYSMFDILVANFGVC